MSKFDFTDTIEAVKGSFKDVKSKEGVKLKERRLAQLGVGDSLPTVTDNPEDFVVMPEWYQEIYGVKGLFMGHVTQVAGDSDTGKTSICLEAIKRAQDQGFGVIYIETELKTGEQDLIDAGIDPKGVMIASSNIVEEAWDSSFRLWDQFFKKFPEEKLLFVFDSYGNTLSLRDSKIDFTEDSQKPGGAAKVNKMGLESLLARMVHNKAHLLIINRTYVKMGFMQSGDAFAGGKALYYHSQLIIKTKKVKPLTKTVKGRTMACGMHVKWFTEKNHYQKGNYIKEVEFEIGEWGFREKVTETKKKEIAK